MHASKESIFDIRKSIQTENDDVKSGLSTERRHSGTQSAGRLFGKDLVSGVCDRLRRRSQQRTKYVTICDNHTPAGVPTANYGKPFAYIQSCLPVGPTDSQQRVESGRSSSSTRQFMMSL